MKRKKTNALYTTKTKIPFIHNPFTFVFFTVSVNFLFILF